MPLRYRGKRRGPRRVKRKGSKPGKRKFSKKVHSFTRTFQTDTAITIGVGSPAAGYGYSFKLNDLPNASEFTALFDQYRIKALKWHLIPKQGMGVMQAVPTAGGLQPIMPKIYTVVDYDDAAPPTSIDEMLQYQNVKITRANQWHSRYFKPAIADEVYATGITTGYGMRQNAWLDCNSSLIEHYGIKVFVEEGNAQTPRWDFDIVCKFYMEFKNVR